jgi:hypothetical protein
LCLPLSTLESYPPQASANINGKSTDAVIVAQDTVNMDGRYTSAGTAVQGTVVICAENTGIKYMASNLVVM